MSKKVIKGWLAKNVAEEVFQWQALYCNPTEPFLQIYNWRKIWRYKRKENDWNSEAWPPKRVIITIEIED